MTKSDDDGPTVAVVLVNWNNEDDTAACLDSLAEQTFDDYQVIVVDNGSEPSSYRYLTERYEWPTFVRNETNLGFTGGNNVGIEEALDAGAEYVLLLNNDTELGADFLEDLLAAAEGPAKRASVIGPKIHTYGTEDVWAAGGHVNPLTGETNHRKDVDTPFDTPEPVDYVVGAAMLVKSTVFEEIGLLDEDFFIYYGETEFCTRVRESGQEVWYVPVEGVYHKETVEYTHSTFREYYFTRNRYLFVQKTQPLRRRIIFYGYFFVRWVLLQLAYLIIVERETGAARATVRGAFDAIRGETGERGQ